MKRIAVLGGGISGYGSAILAKKKGFDVFLSDMGKIADRYKAKLDEWQVPYEEGGHTEERILAAHEVNKSPGIPETAPHGAENPCGRHSHHFEMEFVRPRHRPVEVHLHHRLETARPLPRRSSTRSCATPG